jgi:hypothetical protein
MLAKFHAFEGMGRLIFPSRDSVAEASSDLSVQVIDNCDIVITIPEAGFGLTYRKDIEYPCSSLPRVTRREDPDH